MEPDVQQIAILDAPVVLGLARWREIGSRYGLGLAQELLQQAMTANQIAQQPVAPLAQVMLGALREAAFYLREHQAEGVDAETGIRGVLDRIVRTL